VLVQGTGSVGAKLARLLLDAGAVVLVSDVDEERARATGGKPIPADAALELECDVYAPCALGATLNAESIPRLRCRVVAGAANNQLATPEDGERLRAAGILYAPDYLINSGGALHGIGLERLGWDADRLEREVEGIGDTLAGIFATAEAEAISTDEAAERLASERLASAG
jgi:leucine dehydrogenase